MGYSTGFAKMFSFGLSPLYDGGKVLEYRWHTPFFRKGKRTYDVLFGGGWGGMEATDLMKATKHIYVT